MKSPLVSLALFSLALGLTACSSDAALEIPDLGIVVMAPEGYTVEEVVEGGFTIYRVYNGEMPIADFEEHEGYDFEMSKLETIDGVKEILDEFGTIYTVLDEEQGEYGASVLYETPEYYGVMSGLSYEGIEVVCQAAETEEPADEKAVFNTCKNALPAEVYESMQSSSAE
jgi:hypothetical protein